MRSHTVEVGTNYRACYSCSYRRPTLPFLSAAAEETKLFWQKETELISIQAISIKSAEKGKSWEKIAKVFSGRSVASCQNRYGRIKGASHPTEGAARDSRRASNDSSDDEEGNNTSNNAMSTRTKR
jgi:hypothetical protein